jgi:hypothetical protein
MDRISVTFVSHLKLVGTSIAASVLILSACAPLPPGGNATNTNAQPPNAASATAATPQLLNPRAAQATSGPLGEQHIAIGGGNGYRTEIVVTPPKQVCDLNAFTDGIQYGYAYTWNRLVTEQAREPAKHTGSPQPQFDPSTIQLQDEQYRIVWNGTQRVNACASDGYLIGRIVGTHRAYVDLKGGST